MSTATINNMGLQNMPVPVVYELQTILQYAAYVLIF